MVPVLDAREMNQRRGFAAAIPQSLAVPHLHGSVLIQLALCAFPILLGNLLGRPVAGGFAFLAVLLMLFIYHSLKRQPFHHLSLLIAALPLVVFVRNYSIPFNSVVALLAWGLSWALLARGDFQYVWRRKTVFAIIAGSILYWWFTFLLTGRYSDNMRALEWSFSAAVTYMLSSRRSYFATAIVGIAISAIFLGVGLMPYGDRLGMAVIAGVGIGNPILLGLPTALVFVLSFAEGGKWLLLNRRPLWRLALTFATGIVLVFSTSRGSWAVAIIGLTVLFILDRKARTGMLISIPILVVGLALLWSTPRGRATEHYLMKAVSSDNSAASRTNGRSGQWTTFPEVLGESPVWGFGPGSGRRVSVQYARENIPYHSLFLHVGAEMGILGLTLLGALLWVLIRRDLLHYSASAEVVPLLGTISFIVTGLSVSGLDSLGGMMIGIGLIGGSFPNFWVLRETQQDLAVTHLVGDHA